ncbi:hypothetical protein [Pontibacillus yanchengensis]|uniref:Uncharacterized protein n=1 Tax=Pontibacillus yanchengensis Y32 TaxID=1385514 RepID=A0A0A2TGF3_9BACI|nr:hypothetical protein [Pontibacillus yanchengensis]KGP73508.1 hypothetical protein N782_04625 [Pontibacillus yanchengensis Y32]
MNRELLHERVYALKYVLEGGQVDLGSVQREIEQDLDQVKTAKDGMIDPETVSPKIIEIVKATLDQEQH